MDVNLTGTFLCCREAAKVMIPQGRGSIVNIASVGAFISFRPAHGQVVPYTTSKAAIVHMTQDLAAQWSEKGIRVNAIAPGQVESGMTYTLDDAHRKDVVDSILFGPDRQSGGGCRGPGDARIGCRQFHHWPDLSRRRRPGTRVERQGIRVKADDRFILPAVLREQYYRAGQWRSEDLWTSFVAVAARRPQATAFVDGERRITFAALGREAERFSCALREQGLKPGDVAVIHGRHCIESNISILGGAHSGVVVALLPHLFSTDQIRGVLDNTGARVLVSLGEPAEVERARQATRERPLAAFVVADTAKASDAPADGSVTTWSAFLTSGDGRKKHMSHDRPMHSCCSCSHRGRPASPRA